MTYWSAPESVPEDWDEPILADGQQQDRRKYKAMAEDCSVAVLAIDGQVPDRDPWDSSGRPSYHHRYHHRQHCSASQHLEEPIRLFRD